MFSENLLQNSYYVITLIGFAFLIWNTINKKENSLSKDIEKIKIECPLKHSRIDDVIQETRIAIEKINNSLMLLKENDIKHIEQEMRKISDIQTRILTTIEIRFKDNK